MMLHDLLSGIVFSRINRVFLLQELKALLAQHPASRQHPQGCCRLTADLWMIQPSFEEGLAQWSDVCPAHALTLNSGD